MTNLTVSRLLADRRGLPYIQLHVLYTGQAYRLFGGGKKQGQASEPLEVGDLLRWAFKGGCAVLGVFLDSDCGQKGGRPRACRAVRKASYIVMTLVDGSRDGKEDFETAFVDKRGRSYT